MSQNYSSHSSELLFEEKDEAFYLSLKKTKDGKFVSVCSNSKNAAEIRLIDADDMKSELVLVEARSDGFEYYLDHSNGKLFLLHNGGDSGPHNFELAAVSAPPLQSFEPDAEAGLQRKNWTRVVAGNDDRIFEDMDVFKTHCALYSRVHGRPLIEVIDTACDVADLAECNRKQVERFPTHSESVLLHPGVNANDEASSLIFSLQSPIDPPSHYHLSLDTMECERLRVESRALRLPKSLTCYKVNVPSHDGVLVPMTLVHHKDCQLDGPSPTLLRGYGAYGDSIRPEYEADTMALLQRGWVVATAHVRGGGELGRRWYNAGKLLQKKNSFHDFLSCAQYLVDEGLTQPQLLSAEGSSAGGLLVATSMLWRPDLFGAVALRAPFVNVLDAMLDPNRAMTVHEYDEWGNPSADATTHNYIQSYCPTQLVRRLLRQPTAAEYPSVLITMDPDDTRVDFNDVAQFAGHLQRLFEESPNRGEADHAQVLLHTNGVRGHSGGGRYVGVCWCTTGVGSTILRPL